MTWRDQLREASFRGVPFYIDSHDARTGRKVVRHEYPMRDDAFVEDLGRRGRSFILNAYVLGPDYFADRDRLIDACEEGGPGTLVHPYLGEKQVAVGDLSVTENVDEGGIVRFTIEFLETAEKALEPRASVDTASAVISAADSAIASVRDAFTTAYRIVSEPQFALDSLADLLGENGAFIRSTVEPALATAEDVADLVRETASLVENTSLLVRNPEILVDSVLDVFSAIRSLTGGRSAVTAHLKIAGFVPATAQPNETTPTRVTERQNQDALTSLIRQSAVIDAAREAPGAEYDSYEDAIAVRDLVIDALDAQADTAPDDLFGALIALRARVVKAVPPTDHALARLVAITPPVTVPSLALSYDLYDSVDQEADILRRNGIRHPGFVTGGVQLEVLSRGS